MNLRGSTDFQRVPTVTLPTVTKYNRYKIDRYKNLTVTFLVSVTKHPTVTNRYTIESFRVPPKKYFTDSYICVATTLGSRQQAKPVFPVLFYLYIGRTKPVGRVQERPLLYIGLG